MRFVFSLTLSFQFFFAGAQLKSSETELLRQYLFEQVNDLRKEKGAKPLAYDEALKSAAEFHAAYMSSKNKLTHDQPIARYGTPANRVAQYSDAFETVGENVLFSAPQKLPLSDEAIKQLAHEMFTSWKNSKGHYANMINPEYELGDFGFSFEPKTGKVFAAQVFGTRGAKIDGQLSKNAFGVKLQDKTCDDLLGANRNSVTNMGNAVAIVNDTIYLWHHSESQVRKVVTGKQDGVAVDLVERKQFNCAERNQLDVSQVYDGVMLEPVYSEKLFENNRAQSDYRLVTPLGIIPESMREADFQPSLIIIKDGKKCAYTTPCEIPNGDYALVDVEPVLIDPPNVKLVTSGTVESQKIVFNFKRESAYPSNPVSVKHENSKISSIEIMAYSSVEGDTSINYALQRERVQMIEKYVRNHLSVGNATVSKSQMENWPLCYYQLELYNLDKVARMPKDSIRKFVMRSKAQNWDSLLTLQRESYAIVHYKGTWETADEDHASLNLRTAILTKNYAMANKAMAAMYKEDIFHPVLFEDAVMDAFMKEARLVQNAAALFYHEAETDNEAVVRFVRNWLKRASGLPDDAVINLIQLYCVSTRHLLNDWDVHSSLLGNVMHPSKVKPLVERKSKKENHVPLLNYHMAALLYYGQVNDGAGINLSFDFIVDHFKKRAVILEDEIKICLFFNNWSRYDLTTELLLKRMNAPNFNEDAAFVLAQTALGYDRNVTPDQLTAILKRAMSFNKDRWCEMIKNQYQALRNTAVKQVYCQECGY